MSTHKDLEILRNSLKGPILKIEDPVEYETLDILKSYFREILVIAKSYTRPTVDYEDLVVEGIIGLLDAIKRFDKEKAKGNKRAFHNLAIVRIKSYMFEFFLANSIQYTVPNYMARAMNLVEQIRNTIHTNDFDGDRQDTLLSFESPEFEACLPQDRVSNFRNQKEKLQNLAGNSGLSYEQMVANVLGVERDIENYEREGEPEVSPEEITGQREYLEKFLEGLSPKARSVISLLLQGYTLDEAGEKQGFTRERARQIKGAALEFFQNTRMYRDANE